MRETIPQHPDRTFMSSLEEAVRLLEDGNWQAAHEIVMNDPSPLAAWAHGIVHTLEGDMSNAGYWYRKAQRRLPEANAAAGEIAALKKRIDSASGDGQHLPPD